MNLAIMYYRISGPQVLSAIKLGGVTNNSGNAGSSGTTRIRRNVRCEMAVSVNTSPHDAGFRICLKYSLKFGNVSIND